MLLATTADTRLEIGVENDENRCVYLASKIESRIVLQDTEIMSQKLRRYIQQQGFHSKHDKFLDSAGKPTHHC